MLKLGSINYPTARPADADAALVAATGCNVAEHVAMLERGGTAFQVAQAAAPFLKDAPAVGEIAGSITDDDLADARRAVIALLQAQAPGKVEKAA